MPYYGWPLRRRGSVGPEIPHGHLPGAGGTALLPRQIGYGRGAYYLLTGDEIPAGESERLGLVAKVVPAAAL